MNIEAFLQAKLAKPLTHSITTTYEDGRVRTHYVRSQGQAENYAIGQRRKIGLELIDRDTGRKVQISTVTIAKL